MISGNILKVGRKKPLDLLLLRQIILGRWGSDSSEPGRAIALAADPRFMHISPKPIPRTAKEQAQLGNLGKETSE